MRDRANIWTDGQVLRSMTQRTYRRGGPVVPVPAVPPSIGLKIIDIPSLSEKSDYMRYKLTLSVHAGDGAVIPAGTVVSMDVAIMSMVESTAVTRHATIRVEDSEVFYLYGTSLQVLCTNTSGFDLTVGYQIDEESGGLARWDTVQVLRIDPAVNTTLNVPEFCNSFDIYTDDALHPIVIRGQILIAGVMTTVWTELLPAPRSGEINLIENAGYTVTTLPATPIFRAACVFHCFG